MSEFKYNNYERIARLQIADIFFYCLKQLKFLLVAMVFTAIVVAVIAVGEFTQRDTNKKGANSVYLPSKEELENMAYIYECYTAYEKKHEHYENSILSQLDFSKVSTGKIQYTMIYKGDAATFIPAMRGELLGLVEDENILSEIKEKVYPDKDIIYISELMQASIDSLGNFNYIIYAEDNDTCKKIMDIIAKHIDTCNSKFAENYGDVSLIKNRSDVIEGFSEDILSKQTNTVNSINSYLNTYKNVYSQLETDEVVDFYDNIYLVEMNKGNEITIENISDYVNQNESASMGSVIKTIIKYIVLYVFLVVVLWFAFGFVTFILNAKIKNPEELSYTYGLMVIGSTAIGKENEWSEKVNNLDKRRDKLLTIKELEEKINAVCKEPIVICGEYGEVIFEDKTLQDVCYGNIYTSVDTLRKAGKNKKIILSVAINKTRYEDLANEMNMCQMQGIEVLGAICFI